MKVKIIINTAKLPDTMVPEYHRAEVWSGELDIAPKGEYLTKISIIAEGINEPICEVPFSPLTGYYQWVPPLVDDDGLEEVEEWVIENTDPL